MSRANTSSAYELEEQHEGKREQERRELKVLKSRRFSPGTAITGEIVLAFMLIVTLASLIVYNQAKLNMLTKEMDALAQEMQALESESVRMSSQLSTSINDTAALKERAAELGMQERTEYQTRRIYLYNEDRITRTEQPEEPAGLETAKLALSSILGQFKEYPDKR
jgi:cell division protein FtsL